MHSMHIKLVFNCEKKCRIKEDHYIDILKLVSDSVESKKRLKRGGEGGMILCH